MSSDRGHAISVIRCQLSFFYFNNFIAFAQDGLGN